MPKIIRTLQLLLLGTPRILFNGEQAYPDTRKAVAMFAFLAVTGRQHTREALAALLYPEYDEAHARSALRRTLHTLNSILPENFLQISRQHIAIKNDQDLWVDVVRYKSLLGEIRNHPHSNIESCGVCLTKLEEADDLYQGDFMAGFSLRDSPTFDDWQFFEREELRRDQAMLLEALAHSHRSNQNFEKGIDFARRWLSLDNLVEDAHRELIRCYAASGRRSAAIRQYQECVRILEQELGVPPLEETTQLYQAVLENRFDLPRLDPSQINPDSNNSPVDRSNRAEPLELITSEITGARYPLVGRSQESEEIVQTYIHRASKGFFFGLVGEAGIGKTRLAEEFLASVRSQGAVTLQCRCYEGESNLAYSPIVDALNGALSDSNLHHALDEISARYLSEAARLLPILFEIFPNLPNPDHETGIGSQTLFYESIRNLLLHLCHSSKLDQLPGVIFIDDLQWADHATLDFLAYFLRRIPGQQIFLLVTWRNECHPNQDDLNSLLANAQRAGYGSFRELKRLNPNDVRELLRVARSRSAGTPAGIEQQLYQETEGLPFFIVEYLDTFLRSRTNDEMNENNSPLWTLPASVRDLLSARIQGLDELSRQLLTTAAVIGRSFDFNTLTAASGRSEIETIAGLEVLTDLGLIEECTSCDSQTSVEYDFTHEKLRSLVIEETSLIRRRLLHRRVAQAYLNQKRSQLNPSALDAKIAHHYTLAGEPEAAAGYFKSAGDHARSLYANRDALTHYNSALDASDLRREELQEAIGDLHVLLGEYSLALSAYQLAGVFHPQILHKIGRVYLRKGDWAQAIENLKTAFEQAHDPNERILKARILADWSLSAYQNGQKELAQDLAENALRSSQEINDQAALNQVHNLLGILARSNGDHQRAITELETSLSIASTIQDESAEATAMNNLALVLSDIGELEKAIGYTKLALDIYHRLGDLHRAAALYSNLADLLHKTGQGDLAMEHLTQAVTLFKEIGDQADGLQPEIWKLTEW